MKTLRTILGLLAISIVFVTCKKDENHYLDGYVEVEGLQEIDYTVVLPEGASLAGIANYTVSNAYGDYPISIDGTKKMTSGGVDSLSTPTATVKVFENGSYQLIYLNDEKGNPIMVDILKINGALVSVNELSVENTAIAMLMTHYLLVNIAEESYEQVRAKIIALPEFVTYKDFVEQTILQTINQSITPDFTASPSYKQTVLALFNTTMENFNIPVGTMEINLQERQDGVLKYSLKNEHKRTLHFYPKRIWLDNNGLEVNEEAFNMFEDVNYEGIDVLPYMGILKSKGFDFWGSIWWGGDFWTAVSGGSVSVFETESETIEHDLGDANQLNVEVYGLGKMDTPYDQLTDEEQTKFLIVALHGAYSDFISPLIDLAMGAKKQKNEQKYDFRFGSRKAPWTALLKALAQEFASNPSNHAKVLDYMNDKDYMALSGFLGKFILTEIIADAQPSTEKRRYINHIYNIYKNQTGISISSNTFRSSLKKGLKGVSSALKIVSLAESAVDVAAAIHAYYNTPFQHIFKLNKTAQQEVNLIYPSENENIASGYIDFDWSYERGGQIGAMFYNLIVKETLANGQIKTHLIEDLTSTHHLFNTADFEPNSFNFTWQVEVRRLNTSQSLMLASDIWPFTYGADNSITLPTLQTPTNGATNVPADVSAEMAWTLASWNDPNNTAPISYDLHFGENSNPPQYQAIPAGNTTPISSISTTPNTTYYWKVVAKNGADILGETPVWSFATATTGGGGTPGATVFVAGGTFSMGSTTGSSDESPVHSVTLSDFSIGKYEVTNAEYAAFLNSQGNQTEGGVTWLDINDEHCQIELVGSTYQAMAGKGNHPVIEVTWYGAKAYATWVGGRLPTEAEWEYAARGGNQSNGYTYSGSNTVGDVAWYSSNTTGTNPQTEPIGTKTANELGIHDMSGNVWEWCNDWYGSNYYSSSPSTNPTGPTTGSYRVLRGGSWYYSAYYCRVADRDGNGPINSYDNGGFRVVF